VERVAFVIEHSGERISCLLNPESVVLRRRAGIETRASAGGLVTGAELADDPVFFTGGGKTELTLDLLFDVTLPGSSLPAADVRELTGPLWRLAENGTGFLEQGRPPPALFVWGKAMKFLGVVAAVAERLEYFSVDGVPQRSWLRLRMLRVAESDQELGGGALLPPLLPDDLTEAPLMPDGPSFVHTISTADAAPDDDEAGSNERLDLIAHRYYGDSSQWRVLAWLNDISDPLRLGVDRTLQIATRSDVTEPSP
jgi:hypothetical protein